MKRKWLILFFLLFLHSLFAEESPDFFDVTASQEHILDRRQNYFLTSTDYKISPKVNPITGEYCEEELDLIFDGQWCCSYDTQDRLIALENGSTRIEYTYDPFHRRLSKTVLINGKRLHYERYLWDGDHEIGVIDEKGKITQLRVLGEGLAAEIGAAVLYELNDKTYVPLHDHNGNVAVLIDIKTQAAVETSRYTAFGEELTSATLSPWRFSSKRIEQENGLIFFGRRYYLPRLGRWVTQDPQGFDDGPNLYVYLSNCPLIRIDPYGLWGWMSMWDSAKSFGWGASKYLYDMG